MSTNETRELIKDVMYGSDIDWVWDVQKDTLTYPKSYQLHSKIGKALATAERNVIERVKTLLPEMRLPPKGNDIPFDWGVETEEDEMKRIGFNTALSEVKAILDSLTNDSSKE